MKINHEKYYQDLLNYQYIIGNFEELEPVLFIAA
jgi:hypothetical protein